MADHQSEASRGSVSVTVPPWFSCGGAGPRSGVGQGRGFHRQDDAATSAPCIVHHVKRRPLGIWIIVTLQMLLAVSLLAGVVTNTDVLSSTSDQALEPATRVAYLAWAVMTLVFAFWLWRLKRRGWVLTMVLTGLSLAANLAEWWSGDPNFVRMAFPAATAFYLNSAPVRDLFLPHDDREAQGLPADLEA